jgi:hypothetical protein
MTHSAIEPASADELRHLLGEMEDSTIASILATGATREEVIEALQWLKADDEIGTELEHTRRGAAGEVYDILAASDYLPNDR